MAAASVCAQPTPIKVAHGLSPASHMSSVGAAFAQTLCAKAPGKFKVALFPNFALGGERIIPEIIPFVILVFGCLMVITYFPPLSLFSRDLVYH